MGGDSLHGRYHYHRLHPYSLAELGEEAELEALLRFGGFPEPLFRGSERFWRRWQRERQKRVIYEDLVSLEYVKDITQLELLVGLLPTKVGSPLSIKKLREELSVAHETAERWIQILENLYFCFRVSPFGFSATRAVKKERKLFFWDWSLCKSEGARFENLVASQLLKYCHFIEDNEGYEMGLHFVRDIEKREIDFVVTRENKPLFAVECKVKKTTIDDNIKYFSKRLSIPNYFQVHLGTEDFENKEYKVRIVPWHKFVRELGLP